MTSYKLWTPQEDAVLIEKTATGKFSYEMTGKLLGRSLHSCQNRAKILGLRNLYKGGSKYSVDENFWKPNPISAYWAGFSAADASIRKHSLNCFQYRLELSSEDRHHLFTLKSQCNFTGPIAESLRENKFLHSRILISCPQWTHDLEKYYNIIPNKTKRLAPPNLTDEYLKFCYLIGYLDGDGTISLNKKEDFLTIRFLSCSPDIINWCHEFLMSKFENVYLRKKTKKVCLSMGLYPNCTFSGIRAVAIFDYLSKFDLPKLDRKWKQPKVLKYVSAQKLKYPQFFSV